MNARKGIKTENHHHVCGRLRDLLKTMNARKGIKTFPLFADGFDLGKVKNNECP